MALARAAVTAGTAAPLPCRAGASAQGPCCISTPAPPPPLWGCGTSSPSFPAGSCQGTAALSPGMCSGSLPHAQHPDQATLLSPGIQGHHEATCRSQSTPTAFPSPVPHGTGITKPRGPILHRASQKTAPQAQAPRLSAPQGRTGTHRVEVPRCRWLREGARPVSQLSRGCQSPASVFGPAPARTFALPGGTLFRHVPSSSPSPAAPTDPGPHRPPPPAFGCR